MGKSPLALLIVGGPAIVLALGYFWIVGTGGRAPLEIPATGSITIALAGDVLLTGALGEVERDARFQAIHDIVRSATFATANLDMNLLGSEEALGAAARPAPRWPFASAREAGTLADLGFDAIALANDHAADYGPDATLSTIRVLDEAGLLHAGTGTDLAAARQPALAGVTRKIAFLSIAASSQPDARATLSRADIAGRPGLNPLRYTADITVDAATFLTLKESIAVLDGLAGERELVMFGTRIKKGARTIVEFVVDEDDERAMLEAIAAARAAAEVVVVSVHSHEPANASEEPAAFVRRFARAAIDRGAAVVVGHGPHRLRGLEVYEGGVIFYSLGNFLYQTAGLDFRAANLFDAGADLHQLAVGGLGEAPEPTSSPPDDPAWWEGLLPVATFDDGRLTGIRLVPLDLGADKFHQERGIPRRAESDHARGILTRVRRLSERFGGLVEVEGTEGRVRVDSPHDRAR